MNPNRQAVKSHNSLILIGMPGAGKSTLGALLAKNLAKDFVDTDLLIQRASGKTLQTILNEEGYQALRKQEEEVLLGTQLTNHIIATGGSAVYSQAAMQHLQQFGPVIFLDASIEELQKRIHNMDSRGITRRDDQSFSDVYHERRPLYLHYADSVICCDGKDIETLLDELTHQALTFAPSNS